MRLRQRRKQLRIPLQEIEEDREAPISSELLATDAGRDLFEPYVENETDENIVMIQRYKLFNNYNQLLCFLQSLLKSVANTQLYIMRVTIIDDSVIVTENSYNFTLAQNHTSILLYISELRYDEITTSKN